MRAIPERLAGSGKKNGRRPGRGGRRVQTPARTVSAGSPSLFERECFTSFSFFLFFFPFAVQELVGEA